MGLFDFVKAAGRMLGIGKTATADDKPAPTPTADDIRKEIESHGLKLDGMEVKVEGDKVIVSGAAADAETREKIIMAAGNISGVAQVQDDIRTPAPAPDPVFHTVVKGDTLWAIAKKHYGNGADYMRIFEANKPMLSHPDKIYVGQNLRIPPK